MSARRLFGSLGAVGALAILIWLLGHSELKPVTNVLDLPCDPVPGATRPTSSFPCTRSATLVGENPGYLGPGGAPDGTLLGSARWGANNDQDSSIRVVILGDSVIAAGVPWARVYVPAQGGGGGSSELFTWLPVAVDGKLRLVDIQTPECPPTRDNLSTLGALDPFTRARCLGSGAFTATGVSGRTSAFVGYDVRPEWLSGWHQRGASFSIRDAAVGEPIDVVTDDGNVPPPDFTIELTAHVADPAAEGCVRTPTTDSSPSETREDGVRWCQTRVVSDSWVAVLGPEGRPIDKSKPQLHRHQPLNACAGTNGGVLTFRINAAALDPVWLEHEPGGEHVVATFTDAFQPAFQPDLVIVDATGSVVARDGTQFDPDRGLAGHFTCHSATQVTFD